MGRYLEMLLAMDANFQKPQTGNLQNPQNPEPYPDKGGSVGFEGTPPGTFQKIALPSVAEPTPRSVSLADLSRLQGRLIHHLAVCRDCVIEPHCYCPTAAADGWAYQCLLTDCEDADQYHAAFVVEVIRARICGHVRAREALTRHDRDTGREAARGASYGIDKRPAELAFVNHFTTCTYCFPRSGKYCAEGRELHELALLEALH